MEQQDKEKLKEIKPMGMIQISKEELKRLELCELQLQCLNEMGVDNWSGYQDAMDMVSDIQSERAEFAAGEEERFEQYEEEENFNREQL